MKTLKRIWGNIKWLFNHPPTFLLTDSDPKANTCDYCGRWDGTWTDSGGTICHKCKKKVYDKILLKEN